MQEATPQSLLGAPELGVRAWVLVRVGELWKSRRLTDPKNLSLRVLLNDLWCSQKSLIASREGRGKAIVSICVLQIS